MLAIIESPLRGATPALRSRNLRYARRALQWAIIRRHIYGTPLAGHLLYPQVLDDSVPGERQLGLEMHLSFIEAAALTGPSHLLVFIDHGISDGMYEAIKLVSEPDYSETITLHFIGLSHTYHTVQQVCTGLALPGYPLDVRWPSTGEEFSTPPVLSKVPLRSPYSILLCAGPRSHQLTRYVLIAPEGAADAK